MFKSKFFIVLFSVIAILSSCDKDDTTVTPNLSNPKTENDIVNFIKGGTWESITTELRPSFGQGGVSPQYLKRKFEYTADKRFKGTITNYADIGATTPTLELYFEGYLDFKGADGVIDGAYKVDYVIDRSFKVTAKNQPTADFLNNVASSEGTWTIGVTKELIGKTVPAFGLTAGQNSADYDILFIKDSKLYMGAKPTDGKGTSTAARRSQGVLQVPLVRGGVKSPSATTVDAIKSIIVGGTWKTIATSTELRPTEDRTGTGVINPTYLTREFEYYSGDKFKGVITQFADPARQFPLVKFVFEGTTTWEGTDQYISGAQKITYKLYKSFKLTPLNQKFADQLNSVPTPGINTWQVNVEQDLTGKAFPLFGINAGDIILDHDLIYIYDNGLYMGAKHVNGTSFALPQNRPTGLLQIPLIKQ